MSQVNPFRGLSRTTLLCEHRFAEQRLRDQLCRPTSPFKATARRLAENLMRLMKAAAEHRPISECPRHNGGKTAGGTNRHCGGGYFLN